MASYMKDSDDSEFVDYEEIFETFSPSDRAILKSILEAEGIKYFFQGENVTTYLFQALPVRLMVRKDQADIAKEILKDFNTKPIFASMTNFDDEEDVK